MPATVPITEVAELRGVSKRTIERDWEMARAYLRRLIAGG